MTDREVLISIIEAKIIEQEATCGLSISGNADTEVLVSDYDYLKALRLILYYQKQHLRAEVAMAAFADYCM